MIIFDGQEYESEQDVPDLGQWECVGVDSKPDGTNLQRRSYQGFSNEIDKLPKYDNLATGSSAYCVDTGDLLLYHASTKTWYKQ